MGLEGLGAVRHRAHPVTLRTEEPLQRLPNGTIVIRDDHVRTWLVAVHDSKLERVVVSAVAKRTPSRGTTRRPVRLSHGTVGESGPPVAVRRSGRSAATVLRGGTLVSAPFTLCAIVCLALCALSIAWVFATSPTDPIGGWVTAVSFGLLGMALITAARGCRVVIEGPTLSDQVAFLTVWSTPLCEVVAVRIRRGPWRTFEVERSGGARRVLLGVGPAQFPSNLTPTAAERDRAVIDKLWPGVAR